MSKALWFKGHVCWICSYCHILITRSKYYFLIWIIFIYYIIFLEKRNTTIDLYFFNQIVNISKEQSNIFIIKHHLFSVEKLALLSGTSWPNGKDGLLHAPGCEFETWWKELFHDVSGHHTDMDPCFRAHLHTRREGLSVGCTSTWRLVWVLP